MTTTAPDPSRTTHQARAVEGSTQARHVPHRWRNLATLTGVTVVDSTESGLTTTLFPTIAAALKLNTGQLGLLAALGKIVAVPFGPAWVWLAGRTSRRTALIVATVTGGVFGIVAGFANDFTHLLIANTLMAACIIGAGPISNSIISDSFDDRHRGRAVGYFYGVSALLGSFIGPIVAQLSGFSQGWRYGMWIIGSICILAGLGIFFLYKEPGVGAAERQLADLAEPDRKAKKVTARSVVSLFKIPTFSVMMLSRLMSGHLLIGVFGIQFLVTERGFSNAVAALVLLPFGFGYFAGTVGGGWVVTGLDRVFPRRGRVAFIQAAQILFAVIAFFGTQFHYSEIGVYAIFWALMGFAQGLNPGVNRPIVMSVVTPELRGQAFAIFLTFFETIGWAIFSLGAGLLAESLGIQQVFLWVLVGLMLVNAAVLSALYVTYPKDRDAVTDTLEQRRAAALASE